LVSEQLPDWRMLIDRLHANFDTGDFVTAVKLVDAISQAAEQMNHIPTSTWPTGGSTYA
jgi:4a-hydroxytetrahydrobiopterin dehydratase